MFTTLRNPHLFADTMHREYITGHLAAINTKPVTTILNTVMTIEMETIAMETITEIEMVMVITGTEIIPIIIKYK